MRFEWHKGGWYVSAGANIRFWGIGLLFLSGGGLMVRRGQAG